MCGICGVVGHHQDDVLPLLIQLTSINWYRGHDAVGNTVINHHTGAMRRHVSARKQKSRENPLDGEYRRVVTGNAKGIEATMALGQTKFTTVALSAEEGFVEINTQPLNLSYPRDDLLIPEVTGVHNGEVYVDSITPHIKTPSLSKAVVDSRYLIEIFHEKLREFRDPWQAAEWVMDHVVGAFTFGFSDGKYLFFFKDKGGIRPGVVGRAKGKYGELYVVNSEDGYFGQFGIRRGVEDYSDGHIEGGEAILLQPGRPPVRMRLRKEADTPCYFEAHYLQRHFSLVSSGEMSNSEFRAREAADVAKLYAEDIQDYDFVFPVPKSGNSFARKFADVVRLPYRDDVCRKPEIPGEAEVRNYLIARLAKFHSFEFTGPDVYGKDGVAIDDSIVGGDSSVQLFLDWQAYGGKRLTVVSCAPPKMKKCPYGVGFPEDKDLVANEMLERGIASWNGEIVYDIRDANAFVTDKMRKRIVEQAEKQGRNVEPGDFRVLYAPIKVIRENGRYLSRSGKICDYCLSGRRVDYNRTHDLVQAEGVPIAPRMGN